MTVETEYYALSTMMNFKLSCFIKKYSLRNVSFVFLFAVLILLNNNLFAKDKTCDIFIINKFDQKIKLNVEIADTDILRSNGLMYRKKLDENSGMFFTFDKEMILTFWMKNTYVPLSIAYISKEGVITGIFLMHPLDTSVTYSSKEKSMFAFEVNQGWFSKKKIAKGCRIIFNGCISKQN